MACLDVEQIACFMAGELSADERRSFEEHIDECATCRSWLCAVAQGLPVDPAASGDADADADTAVDGDWSDGTTALLRGTSVGRYVLVDWLGAGAMAAVYSAYDPELDRAVALKIVRLTGDGDRDTRVKRFIREAQAMARLSHPNVVAVYDAGRDGSLVFIAMERIDGVPLSRWLTAAPRTRDEIIDVFVGAGRGLAAAHEAGIVHRDFKPDNVMIDANGSARVADFGLAFVDQAPSARDMQSETGAEAPATGRLTQAGAVLGTPAYMAPEQRRGQISDARGDQYSFCVALYEALGGERGPGTQARSATAMAPKARFPRRIDRILERGLATEPTERFASMQALLAELDHAPAKNRKIGGGAAIGVVIALALVWYYGYRDVEPTSGSTCEQVSSAHLAEVWNPEQRNRLVTALEVTGTPVAARLGDRVSAVIADYADKWLRMRRDACRATHVRGEQSAELLDLRLECLDNRLDEMRVAIAVLAKSAPQTVDQVLPVTDILGELTQCEDTRALREPSAIPDNPDDRAQVRQVRQRLTTAKALLLSRKWQQAEAALESVVRTAERHGFGFVHAEALRLVAELKLQSRRDGIEEAFQRALAVAETIRAEAVKADALIGLLVFATRDRTRFGEAVLLARLIEATLARLPGNQIDRRSRVARYLSSAYEEQGRYEEALHHAQRAYKLAGELHGSDHYNTAHALYLLGKLHYRLGHGEQADTYLQQAIGDLERQWGETHPQVARAVADLGVFYGRMGDYARGRDHLVRAIDIWESALGPEHPNIAKALPELGDLLLALDDPQAALAAFQRAQALVEPARASAPAALAHVLAGLGRAQFALGQVDEAIATLERCLALQNHNESNQEASTRQALNRDMSNQETYRELSMSLRRSSHWSAAKFTLAKALWQTRGNRRRARRLAREAKLDLDEVREPRSHLREQVVQWLAARE